MSRFAKYILFLNSYFPATLAVATIAAYKDQREIAIPFGLFALLGLYGQWLWRRVEAQPAQKATVLRVDSKDSEIGNYVIGYLIPFLGLNAEDLSMRLALLFFFLVFGYIYVEFDLLGVNPMLALSRRRLYQCKLSGLEADVMLIGERSLKPGMQIRVMDLADTIYFELKRPKQGQLKAVPQPPNDASSRAEAS